MPSNGFTQMLLKLLKDYQPHHVAMVFDVGRVTFRTELYPAYKANRAEMPDDLRQQIGPIRDLVRADNTSDNIPGVPGIGDKTEKTSHLPKQVCVAAPYRQGSFMLVKMERKSSFKVAGNPCYGGYPYDCVAMNPPEPFRIKLFFQLFQ